MHTSMGLVNVRKQSIALNITKNVKDAKIRLVRSQYWHPESGSLTKSILLRGILLHRYPYIYYNCFIVFVIQLCVMTTHRFHEQIRIYKFTACIWIRCKIYFNTTCCQYGWQQSLFQWNRYDVRKAVLFSRLQITAAVTLISDIQTDTCLFC